MRSQQHSDPLLQVRDLETHFVVSRETYRAVDRVTFSVDEDETFALVGESGSGTVDRTRGSCPAAGAADDLP